MNPMYGDWSAFDTDCTHLKRGGEGKLERVDNEAVHDAPGRDNRMRYRGSLPAIPGLTGRGFRTDAITHAAMNAYLRNSPYP
jgi:hypothetical protein